MRVGGFITNFSLDIMNYISLSIFIQILVCFLQQTNMVRSNERINTEW